MKTKDRTLPANVDIEKAILGCVLICNELLPDMEPDDFVLDSHRRIFMAMKQMIGLGQAVDFRTLSEYLRVTKELENLGETPIAYLASLTEGLPIYPNYLLREYVRIVKEKAALRRILLVCDRAMNRAYDADPSREIIAELKALSEV